MLTKLQAMRLRSRIADKFDSAFPNRRKTMKRSLWAALAALLISWPISAAAQDVPATQPATPQQGTTAAPAVPPPPRPDAQPGTNAAENLPAPGAATQQALPVPANANVEAGANVERGANTTVGNENPEQ